LFEIINIGFFVILQLVFVVIPEIVQDLSAVDPAMNILWIEF